MKHLIETDGKPSGTKTLFTVCSVICLLKFALSEITVLGVEFGKFDGDGAAMLLGVFGATYFGRRNVKVGTNAVD